MKTREASLESRSIAVQKRTCGTYTMRLKRSSTRLERVGFA